MDNGKIIESTYKWIQVKGAVWFTVFFLITISIAVLVPMMVRQGIFFDEPSLPVVNVLYAFNLLVLFVGFFSLIEFILKFNGFSTQKVTPGKLLDTFFLLALCVWYMFIWNIHKPRRLIQILSLFVCTLALFSMAYYDSSLLIFTAIIFGLLYVWFVITNCIKLSFSYFIFYDRKLSIKHAIMESWKMTENRVGELLTAYLIGGIVVFVFGIVLVFIVASVLSIIIGANFIPPVTYKLAMLFGALIAMSPMLIAEQAFIAEAYAQANLKHEIKKGVANILAKRTLVSDHSHKAKKSAKKNSKKVVKKKALKKKPVRKIKRK